MFTKRRKVDFFTSKIADYAKTTIRCAQQLTTPVSIMARVSQPVLAMCATVRLTTRESTAIRVGWG